MFLQLMVVCLSGISGENVTNFVSAVNSVATGHAPIQHQDVVANYVTQLLPQLKKKNATHAQVLNNSIHHVTVRTLKRTYYLPTIYAVFGTVHV